MTRRASRPSALPVPLAAAGWVVGVAVVITTAEAAPLGEPWIPLRSPSVALCTPAPPGLVADYGAPGPFTVQVVARTGPNGRYTLFRPETLGEGGFLHPVAIWGNGMGTAPSDYGGLLRTLASHGFVVIASDSPRVTAALMRSGLDWLTAQNEVEGDFQGRLALECAASLGHSLGGGAALSAGSHPSVVATVSLHGVEAGGAAGRLHGPLLLLTSTNDGVTTRAGAAQPTYDRSTAVPTLMATWEVPGAEPDFSGHLIPMGSAGPERAPTVAWLRFWVYGDEGARDYFHGAECVVCRAPWTEVQRKNGEW